jgi:hypothetical protein
MDAKFSDMLAAVLRSLAGVVPPERLCEEFARRVIERHEEVAALATEMGAADHAARTRMLLEAKRRFPGLAGLEMLREESGRASLALGRRTFPLFAVEAPQPAAPASAPAAQPAPQAADDDVASRAQFLELD